MVVKNILVTGGCGFIGTQICRELINFGYTVYVIDKISPTVEVPYINYILGDYLSFYENTHYDFDTIIHLAAEHIVPLSLKSPNVYYDNNVIKLKYLLDAMIKKGTKNIIFSSTGNIYGRQGNSIPLPENLHYDPINPYASTKMAGELMIKDYANAYDINYVIFRYFNAAGADVLARNGYNQSPVTHVIPALCENVINNSTFNVFGNDYNTKDGTCIRDYVHIQDIANAHINALDFLTNGQKNEIFNLGGGSNGVSVFDLLKISNEILNKKPKIKILPKRMGDPPILIADINKTEKLLKWKPKYTIRDIISHSYNWSIKGK